MLSELALSDLVDLVGGALGRHDVPCPDCGPSRRSSSNRRRRVLRVWFEDPGFATFKCARCGAKGYAVDRLVKRVDQEGLGKARVRAWDGQNAEALESLSKARWLWSQRQPIVGSIAEKYLRQSRGYTGELPRTLGFLPGRGKCLPAMIAAFGMAVEELPGQIAICDSAVRGVHITRLKPDGSGKAGGVDKLTIGQANTSPIWLAPVSDGLGLSVCEGIEDGLSVFSATGLGVWAAGSAGRLPGIADHVPAFIETVTIIVDSDPAGETNAHELATRLAGKGLEVLLVRPGACT